MVIVVSLLMIAAAVVFVAYPLFRQRMTIEIQAGDEALQELSSKRDTTYAMLKEVEFDYQSGILVEEDYKALQDRYKQKAVSILKELHAKSEADDEVEGEIGELRQDNHPALDNDTEIEQEILQLRKNKKGTIAVEDEDALEREIRKLRMGKGKRTGPDNDGEIEQEILQFRKNKQGTGASDDGGAYERATRQHRPANAKSAGYCTQCGTKAGTADKFCAVCGAKLKQKERGS